MINHAKAFSDYCNQNGQVRLRLLFMQLGNKTEICAPHVTTNVQNLAHAIHYPANWDKADGVLVTNEENYDKKLSTW